MLFRSPHVRQQKPQDPPPPTTSNQKPRLRTTEIKTRSWYHHRFPSHHHQCISRCQRRRSHHYQQWPHSLWPQQRTPRTTNVQGVQHERHPEGPYRGEDVLLSLQLLAYLNKYYPHVRQHFYKTRPSFHPATQILVNKTGPSATVNNAITPPLTTKETNPIFKAFASVTGRGKEKERQRRARPRSRGP